MNSIKKRRNLVLIITISFVALLVFLLYIFRKPLIEILQPIFLALLITYILNPAVNALQAKKIHRGAAIGILYSIIGITLIIVMAFLIPQIVNSTKDLAYTLPKYIDRYRKLFDEFVLKYNVSDLSIKIREIIYNKSINLQSRLIETLQNIGGIASKTITFFVNLILGFIIGFYLIFDIKKFKSMTISVIPRKSRKWTLELLRDIDVVLSGFVRGQILIAIIMSIIITIGLFLLKVRYSLILGIIAGFTNLIPYFGPIIGLIPAVIIAFINKPLNALWVTILYGAVQQLDGIILTPRIVGKKVGLHPIAIIIAILAGGKIFGIIGMLLAVPVTGILKVLSKRIIGSIA